MTTPRTLSLDLTRRALCAGLVAAPFAAPRAARASLARPAGPVILRLTGAIDATNAEGAAEFDLAMLDALPQRETVTATPWHEGRPRFSGPTVATVLEAAGAGGSALRIVALNDYSAEMPMDDALSIPVILATRIDGQGISVRDKGPIFVIYPFDERPDLFNEVYFGRSVWQVAGIEVLA
ncbi:hypothetical protein [Rubellimicrobium aerolatum]|uniref:Oxidoreductase n=1 Tax=Rubellimicrobium aerolatum TaxID=490979 RepID=A0ABW0S8N5_9RHOB|nr:hypothetical protein [Rubellimicrobium aerolatum]MBP1804646.1 hypothetical protein [Rubellimicrobium aerolatum]